MLCTVVSDIPCYREVGKSSIKNDAVQDNLDGDLESKCQTHH